MGNLVNVPTFKDHYDNYINGQFTPPTNGKYFDVVTPLTGKVFTKAAHSSEEDLVKAVDAAHEAFKSWSQTSPTQRSIILNKIADRIEENHKMMLDHYRQTKNMLVSYSKKKLGFF
ncbi:MULTISPECIES: aldehyde dehydrogenase family protein [Empedobacter]|uniref:aldehyde dehydrogenase family protein n=1 Tax=Empedobacter TaxID=59734 RepID=UPI00269884F6